MAQTKKVILFIVEGMYDRISLEEVISRILNESKIQFHIINGDITAKESSSTTTIKAEINNQIVRVLEQNHYRESDIVSVIQIIDTDGAFIPDENVVKAVNNKLEYTEDHILVANPDSILKRNHKKSSIVRLLFSTKKMRKYPYSIYFFSRNLEHALHNQTGSLSENDKSKMADTFSDRYGDDPKAFISLLNDSELKVDGDYIGSWENIFTGTNSLHRGSNFHLFFSENQDLLTQ